ncbi:MAG: MFS transporter [Actinomycetaceae bacterium]|nr:MFS transporter [Actinomycetaceae bacterium]
MTDQNPSPISLGNSTESTILEPDKPGTSAKMTGGWVYRKYLFCYALAGLGIFAIWGSMGPIFLPNQVQIIEFNNIFGENSGVNLLELQQLKAAVEAGTVTPNAEQAALLEKFGQYDSAVRDGLALVTAVGVFLTMLIQPVVGILSDRTRSPIGRRAPWILGGAIGGGLLLLGLRLSPTIIAMAIFWSIAQIAINLAQSPLTTTVADRVVEKKLGTASAMSGIGLMVGIQVGAVLGGELFARYSLDAYYFFIIALMAFALLFVFLCPDRSSKALDVEPFNIGEFLLSMFTPMKDADFRWVWLSKLVLMFGYTVAGQFNLLMMQFYIQPALSQQEATIELPRVMVASLIPSLIAMVIAGIWSDKILKRKPFVFGASVLMAASFLIPWIWPVLPALYVQSVIGGAAMGAFLTVDQALFIDVIPDKATVGRDLGMGNLGGNLGQAIGPVVANAVVTYLGGYKSVWIVSAIIVLVAAFAVIPIKRVK